MKSFRNMLFVCFVLVFGTVPNHSAHCASLVIKDSTDHSHNIAYSGKGKGAEPKELGVELEAQVTHPFHDVCFSWCSKYALSGGAESYESGPRIKRDVVSYVA